MDEYKTCFLNIPLNTCLKKNIRNMENVKNM